jgi:type III restriction enzyme
VGERRAVAVDIAAGDDFALESSDVAQAVRVEQGLDRPGLIRRLLDVIPNPWQGARILDEALATLRGRGAGEADLIGARLTLVEAIGKDVREQVEAASEALFRKKVADGDIVFKLLAAPLEGLNYEFFEMFKMHVAAGDAATPLLRFGGTPLEHSLYDKVFKKDVNGFEAEVALYLDDRSAVEWWWRIAARRDWGLQGWMKNKVYPDFLIQLDAKGGTARMLVLETKGKHLEGSEDTEFKTKFFNLLEGAYTQGRDAGEVELFAERPDAMRFRILIQDEAWKNDVESALS